MRGDVFLQWSKLMDYFHLSASVNTTLLWKVSMSWLMLHILWLCLTSHSLRVEVCLLYNWRKVIKGLPLILFWSYSLMQDCWFSRFWCSPSQKWMPAGPRPTNWQRPARHPGPPAGHATPAVPRGHTAHGGLCACVWVWMWVWVCVCLRAHVCAFLRACVRSCVPVCGCVKFRYLYICKL